MHILYPHRLPLFSWLAVVALVLAVFWPGLPGGFLFDDVGNIVDNPSIQIEQIDPDTLLSSLSGPAAGPLGRPVSVLSFAVTHYFFGLDPFAFKAINLTIHLMNGLLVAWLVSLLLGLRPEGRISDSVARWLPIWVAAIWLVHPINTISVILAVQRMTLLSGIFMLLALICQLKAMSPFAMGKARWLWLTAGWLVFWPLAVLSKETGLLFPLFVLLISLYIRHVGKDSTPSSGRHWVMLGPLLLLLGIGIAMINYLGTGWLEGAYAMRSFSMTERLMTEARVLWFYASQIVVPVHTSFGLYLDDIQISRNLITPPLTLLAIIGWLGVVFGLLYTWRRWPIPSFAVAWFLVSHTLESTFLPLEIAHEYRNYIPSIGLILGVGYVGASWLRRANLDHPRLTASLAALLPLIVLALFTWLRADQWGDPIRGTQLEAMHHPQSSRANYTAAQLLFSSGRGDAHDPIGGQMVRYHFLKAAKVDPNAKLPHLGLIVWSCASGRDVEQDWISGMKNRLEQTPFAPKDLELPGDILKPILNQPDCLDRQQAIDLFLAGSRNSRITPSIQSLFLDSAADYELLVSKDLASATNLLEQAVVKNPGNSDLRRKLKSFESTLSHFSKQGG